MIVTNRPKFKNSKAIDVVGTSFQGTINTSYDRLVETFGSPTTTSSLDGKTQVEWHLKFEDGVIATIYDWKEDGHFSGVSEWHIGGVTQAAVFNVVDCVV